MQRRLFWERVAGEWVAWNEFGLAVGMVRPHSGQWQWVVFDGFRDSRGICPSLREAKARVRERTLNPKTAR